MDMKPALAGLALCLTACGPSAQRGPTEASDAVASVAASDAWCRVSPKGATTGACYVTLIADADDRLTGAATPRAAEVQVHEMSTDNGVMKMGRLEQGLPLTPGRTIELSPGGTHLMLIGLTQPLTAGQAVPLTLVFAAAAPVTIQATVGQGPADDDKHAGH